MRSDKWVGTMLIVSTVLFLTACQKKPGAELLHAAEMSHSKASVTNVLNTKDLGVLPLSDHVSTTVAISNHRQCTITPTVLKSGDLQLILTMETTRSDGATVGMNVARVVTKPGEPFDVSIGDINLAFTPHISVQ